MKKFFLIPLMALFSCVMAWAVDVSTAEAFQDAVTTQKSEINLQNDITVENAQVTIKAGCTVNLNNHTIYYTKRATFLIVDVADPTAIVTINNGTIVYTPAEGAQLSSGNSVLMAKNYSHVIINNVNLGGLDVNGGYNCSQGLYVSGSNAVATLNGGVIKGNTAGVNINAAQFTLENGTIEGGQTGITVGSQTSTFVMNDGVVIGKTYYGVKNQGATTINGGEISTPSSVVINQGSIATTSGFGIFNTGNSANLTINDGSISGQYGIYNTTNAHLTVKGGTITGVSQTGGETHGIHTTYSQYKTNIYPSYTTIEEGATISAQYGVVVLGQGTSLNVNGGTINGTYFAITGNGNAENAGTTINITGGNISGDGAGIYHPQAGSLTIKGNPVITGHTAIQLCAGAGLTGSITGGRFEASGTDGRASKTGDGLVPDGAALSIVNRNYPGGTPLFAVNGGTFLAQHQDAILAYTWSDNNASTWAEATNYLSVREGIFSSNPSAYVPADGYTVTELDPTPTVYNHDVVYSHLWQVAEESHVQSYDFTSAEAEYVEIGTSTTGASIEGTTYSLNEDQSSKKVEVAETYTLVVKEDNTLNIGTGGLVLENDAQFVVEPGAVVTVGTNGIINANGADNIILETNADKQAVLLIDPDVIQNTKPLATVTIHTAARQKSASPYNYIWEYFACPVQEVTSSTKPTNNFDEAVHGLFAGETEFVTGVYTWGGNDWALVNSWTSLVPFKGYQLTNNTANGGVDYTFKGNLMGNGDGSYEFTSNGYGYFGNSYTAPIVISTFLGALSNTDYERTVWLYDAGADTYVSVNPLAARIGSAKYKDGTVIKEIRSLQAFILNKKSDGEGSAAVDYREAIWNNPRINSLVSASPAPARYHDDGMQWTNIFIAANGNKEMVTLVEGADFTNEFDNGADAGKYLNANSMNLYAVSNNGELSMVATDNLENTLLSFQAGNATEYTLTFENSNEKYLLRDNVTGNTIAMEEGAIYTFTQDANTTAQARFEVIGIAKVPTAIENVEETAKKEGIYTISGQYVGRDFTKLPAGVYVVNGVKIVK